jgi:hypothetical protein
VPQPLTHDMVQSGPVVSKHVAVTWLQNMQTHGNPILKRCSFYQCHNKPGVVRAVTVKYVLTGAAEEKRLEPEHFSFRPGRPASRRPFSPRSISCHGLLDEDPLVAQQIKVKVPPLWHG